MVCGGLAVFLTAHGHTDVLSSQILVVVCGGLRWCVVVCGGLWWFAVVCGGLWWIAVVCLLVIPSKTATNLTNNKAVAVTLRGIPNSNLVYHWSLSAIVCKQCIDWRSKVSWRRPFRKRSAFSELLILGSKIIV